MVDRGSGVTFKQISCQEEWDWFHAFVPVHLMSDAKGIIAYIGGVPAAACVLQRWMKGSVEIHWIITKPMILRHGWLKLVAEAAYGDTDRTVFGFISEGNAKSMALAKRVGCREVGRIPGGDIPGTAFVIMAVRQDEFKCL